MSKRDPSIHVKRSSLSEAMGEIVQGDVDFIVTELFHRLNKHAIRNRVVVQPTARAKKTMEKVVSVDKKIADRFHLIYQQVNLDNKIHTTVIKATDSKYATLKEVAMIAKEFGEAFDLDEDTGFKIFVTTGIILAGNNYTIYRLKGLADKILNYYKAAKVIDDDPTTEKTIEFYAAWRLVSIKYMGRATTITEPHMYVHFIYGKDAAGDNDYVDWVSAQFERWAALNSVPELSQFYGDNAELAYTKYMGLKKKKYDSKEEQEYFEEAKVTVKKVKRKKSGD